VAALLSANNVRFLQRPFHTGLLAFLELYYLVLNPTLYRVFSPLRFCLSPVDVPLPVRVEVLLFAVLLIVSLWHPFCSPPYSFP